MPSLTKQNYACQMIENLLLEMLRTCMFVSSNVDICVYKKGGQIEISEKLRSSLSFIICSVLILTLITLFSICQNIIVKPYLLFQFSPHKLKSIREK